MKLLLRHDYLTSKYKQLPGGGGWPHTHLATVTWLLQIWLLRPCLIPITIPTPHSCTPIELSLESELLSSESLLLDSAESIWPISWRPTLLTFCGCVNVFWGEGHSIHTIYMYTHWNNKHTHTCSHMHITCKQTCKSQGLSLSQASYMQQLREIIINTVNKQRWSLLSLQFYQHPLSIWSWQWNIHSLTVTDIFAQDYCDVQSGSYWRNILP